MKWMSLLFTLLLLKACGSSDNLNKIRFKPNQNTFVSGDTLSVTLKTAKTLVDSTFYFLNEKPIQIPYVFSDEKLGDIELKAKIYSSGKLTERTQFIRLLNPSVPELWTYKIVNEFPHDKTAYTQGLEFDGEILFESTGLNGQSSLRKVAYQTGEIIESIPLDRSYFGEGITLLNNTVFQLTWQEGIGFMYDQESLEMKTSFKYEKSIEGWGLCNDGQYLYKSDGTAKIWRLDPSNGKELDYIEATTNKTILSKINELEWVNGKIFANTYQFQKEVAVVIDPKSGAIERVIDFSGLKEKVEQIPSLNVLNGIAYHPKRETFFVTGKNWSKMFEVSLYKK